MSNEHGRYSDVDVCQSIFKYKRSDSLIKITWSPNINEQYVAGTSFMIDDEIIFEGLLNDEGTDLDIKSQEIKFQCFGYESILDKIEVPFSSISIGDTLEEILFTCLNQSLLTEHILVDALNISVPVNSSSDIIEDLENMTVREAVNEILIIANAVLYINNGIMYVTSREESNDLMYTFYGQASNDGIENVNNLSNIKRGQNRIFNLWTWAETNEASRQSSSIDKYGIRKKEMSSVLITNSTKITNSLDALRDEFGLPKKELDLETGIKTERFSLNLLDKINIDYPTVFIPADENQLPLWGKVNWGEFKWPIGQWSLTIPTTTFWKIIGIKFKIKDNKIILKVREV